MSEQLGEKTEQPTQRRLEEAWANGQFARSAEVQRRLGMLWLEVGDLKRASRALEGALKYANKAQFDLVEWAADTFSRRAAGGLDLSHWETLERASGLLDAAEKLQPQRNARHRPRDLLV